MKSPRTFAMIAPFENWGNIILIQDPLFQFQAVREEINDWMNLVLIKNWDIDLLKWEFFPPNDDFKRVQSITERVGSFDIVKFSIYPTQIVDSQSMLEKCEADVNQYCGLGGEKLYSTPGAVFFIVPRETEFILVKHGDQPQKRHFVISEKAETPLIVLKEEKQPTFHFTIIP
jgi:hypothetical protein